MPFSFVGAALLSVTLPVVGLHLQRSEALSSSGPRMAAPEWVLVTTSNGEVLRDALVPVLDESGDCPSMNHEGHCDTCQQNCESDVTCTVFLTGEAGSCDYYWYLNGFTVWYSCKCA